MTTLGHVLSFWSQGAARLKVFDFIEEFCDFTLFFMVGLELFRYVCG